MHSPDRDAILKLARQLTDDTTRLHNSLTRHRKAAGLTQIEVAQRMGCALETVQHFEAYYGMDGAAHSFVQRYALAVGARITTTVAAA